MTVYTTDLVPISDNTGLTDGSAAPNSTAVKTYVDNAISGISSDGGTLIPTIANRYYGPYACLDDGSNFTAQADTVYFMLMYLHSTVTYTRVGMTISTGTGSAQSVRIGVYTVGSDGLADTLDFAGTTLSIENNGNVEGTISYTPSSTGFFYIAMQYEANVSADRYNMNRALVKGLGADDEVSFMADYYHSARAYGSGLEDPYTGTPTYSTTGFAPRVWLRKV